VGIARTAGVGLLMGCAGGTTEAAVGWTGATGAVVG
jgi:hypothetical protein